MLRHAPSLEVGRTMVAFFERGELHDSPHMIVGTLGVLPADLVLTLL